MSATSVLVGERQEGKTAAAIRWLIEGHPVRGWPGWSRVLVVPSTSRAQWMLGSFPNLERQLHEQGNGGLGKLVITLREAHNLRGVDRGVEFAVDDAQEIVAQAIGRIPTFVTYNGTAVVL